MRLGPDTGSLTFVRRRWTPTGASDHLRGHMGATDAIGLPGGPPGSLTDGSADHMSEPLAPPPLCQEPTLRGFGSRHTAEDATIAYVYASTGRPIVDVPDGWDGVTPRTRLQTVGVHLPGPQCRAVVGSGAGVGPGQPISRSSASACQPVDGQVVMLVDEQVELTGVGLPTLAADGLAPDKRKQLIITGCVVASAPYSAFQPVQHGEQMLDRPGAHLLP